MFFRVNHFNQGKHSFSKEVLLPSGERGAGAPGGAWSLGAGGQHG